MSINHELGKWNGRICLVLLALLIHSPRALFSQGGDWSSEDRAIWNKAVKRVVTTPPCCGACSVLRMDDAKKIYSYVTNNQITPEGAALFEKHKEAILAAVKYYDQQRYQAWSQRFLNNKEANR